jgi:hypothetical protein
MRQGKYHVQCNFHIEWIQAHKFHPSQLLNFCYATQISKKEYCKTEEIKFYCLLTKYNALDCLTLTRATLRDAGSFYLE